MERKKIAKVEEVNLVMPLSYRTADGRICLVERFHRTRGFFVFERGGQCYVTFNEDSHPLIEGLVFAIKEKFDDLEGEEIKDAGGNASEWKE